MGQTVLLILLALGFIIIYKLAYDADKHLKWFNSLKPGDKVLVQIYSKYCQCAREAVVIKCSMDNGGKHIEANLLPDVTQRCELCSKVNSIDGEDSTCWYNVTSFSKGNVAPITKKAILYKTGRI
jgi:preprotein translocase subunit YajC